MIKLVILIGQFFLASCSNKPDTFSYPVTPKVDSVDVYFGTKVSDPYRWMEYDKSPEIADWIKAENKITYNYLAQIPYREKIKERLVKIWDYPKMSPPFKEGERYFFYKNNGLQNQSVLHVLDGIAATPRILLDPNTLSADGTVALSDIGISKDGKYIAYGIAKSGSDWKEISIKEIATGKDMDEKIQWVKFTQISWYKDGFYYSRFDQPAQGVELSSKNKYHKIFYHKVGTKQSDDILIYQNTTEPLRTYQAVVTKDEKFLFLYESASTHGNAIFFKDLSKPEGDFIKIAGGFENEFSVIENNNNLVFIKTNYKASSYKLIGIDLNSPAEQNWKDILPEKENVLETASLAGGKIVAQYMTDAHSKLEIYSIDGVYEKDIELSTLCYISGFNGAKNDPVAFYSITSFALPGTVYKYNFTTGKSEIYYQPEVGFDVEQFQTQQVFFKSKDGTKVPMFIVHKKNLVMDGTNPTLLYGYGGFSINQTPAFKVSRIVWLENGGIFCLVNLRGGGEYGEDWHQAGTKLNKQNVFDDFISAAEYMIKEKYTTPEKIAIQGGSNGGLLVGACVNQRPDLFKVALPNVGVMDMLRYHKFTIGWSWVADYGSSDDSVQFNYIYKYSPLHNIKTGIKYPAIFATTADHDDRVVPAHSFKYIATMQEKYKGPNPALILVDVKAGHGAGKPVSKQIESSADAWSFTFFNMGIVPKY